MLGSQRKEGLVRTILGGFGEKEDKCRSREGYPYVDGWILGDLGIVRKDFTHNYPPNHHKP